MSKPLLQIIVASTRPGRVGAAVADWIRDRAGAHGGFAVEVVDLAEVDLPFLDEPHHPRLGRYVHQHTEDWSATVSRADAFVFVTPEYNHGYPAALKNAIDFLHAEWQHKPVGFVSYGGVAGGTRAVQALKPVLASLKMVPAVAAVPIPFVATHLDDGRFQPTEALEAGADAMLDELAEWTAALAPLRRQRSAAA